MSNSATAARRSAIYLLDQVLGEGRLLSECLAAGAHWTGWAPRIARVRNVWRLRPCADWNVPTGCWTITLTVRLP